jgi:hypothetical protein
MLFIDEMRARIRRLNYNIRTEDAFVDWVRWFILSMSGATRAILARHRSKCS